MNLKKTGKAILSGIAAGMVMGAVGYILFTLGLMGVSGVKLNAEMVLPPELMDSTVLVWITGMAVHMVFSSVFALVFVYLYEMFVGYNDRVPVKSPVIWGLLYGVAIFIFNAGIMAPMMELHKPFWQMPPAGFASSLGVRLLYGSLMAYFASKWALPAESSSPAAPFTASRL